VGGRGGDCAFILHGVARRGGWVEHVSSRRDTRAISEQVQLLEPAHNFGRRSKVGTGGTGRAEEPPTMTRDFVSRGAERVLAGGHRPGGTADAGAGEEEDGVVAG
jgi:hypothetical protein